MTIKMTTTVAGVELKRSISGWVGTFAGATVAFSKPTSVWVARRRFGLEPLCVGPSLESVVAMTEKRYSIEDA